MMSQVHRLPLILGHQPEGRYLVTCPLLPELITEGDNVQDALQNAYDALTAIVEASKELKLLLPLALRPADEQLDLWVETFL